MARPPCQNAADLRHKLTKTPFCDQKEIRRFAEVGRGKGVNDVRKGNCVIEAPARVRKEFARGYSGRVGLIAPALCPAIFAAVNGAGKRVNGAIHNFIIVAGHARHLE